MSAETTLQALEAEISHLKTLLATSRSESAAAVAAAATHSQTPLTTSFPNSVPLPLPLPSHALLLLSDSALPLGSFAFSSGLESYLAHNKRSRDLAPFLSLSILSLASTSLPYVLAAHRAPPTLQVLDSTLDACILCPVARRASVAQGRALLTVWERAFRAATAPPPPTTTRDEGGSRTSNGSTTAAEDALANFGAKLKTQKVDRSNNKTTTNPETDKKENGTETETEIPNGHFAPLWAVVAHAMGVAERETAYVFILNHAKAVVSAAVRASVMGPYQAQGLLASGWLRGEIERVMDENWDVGVEDAGQTVPAIDLWMGRHEKLYSRIFNS